MSRPFRSRRRRGSSGGGRGRPAGRESRLNRADRAHQLLLDAWRKLEDGEIVPALEAAGESVYLDPKVPSGYLIIGDIHLRQGDFREAREAFDVARKKAARAAREGRGDEELIEALSGIARCDLMVGALEQAAGSLRAVLEADAEDRQGVRQLLAEVQLMLGRPDACLEVLSVDDPQADAHVVAAFALLDLGRRPAAVERLRHALLRNFYLPAAFVGEEPPDLGIVHGTEEAGVEFAVGLADRLLPYTEGRPDHVDFLAMVATAPTVMREVEEIVNAARSLNREADPTVRSSLVARIATLRDPERIRGTTEQVYAELERDV